MLTIGRAGQNAHKRSRLRLVDSLSRIIKAFSREHMVFLRIAGTADRLGRWLASLIPRPCLAGGAFRLVADQSQRSKHTSNRQLHTWWGLELSLGAHICIAKFRHGRFFLSHNEAVRPLGTGC